jgi:hypothetical protein
MTTYWFMFAFPLIGLLARARASSMLSLTIWLLSAAGFVILIGFRHEVGPDWHTYVDIYTRTANMPFTEAMATSDPGYTLLNWISGQIGGDVYLVNLVSGAILMAGIVVFARSQPLPWLAFFITIPYLINVVGMSLVRQSIAIGLELLALVALTDNRVRRYVILVLAACLFHKTAIFLLPIAAFLTTQRRAWTIFWVGVTFLGLAAALVVSSFEYFFENYFRTGLASDGGGIRVAMNIVATLLFFLLHKELVLSPREHKLWMIMAVLSLSCLPMLIFTSTAADRLALYMLPLQIFVFARLPLLVGPHIYRAAVAFGVVLGYGLFQLVWEVYGNYTREYMYRFIPIS